MTEKQMRHIAGRKLALHWIKLYCPNRVNEWARKEKVTELPDEFTAFLTAMNFFNGKSGSFGYRLMIFIQAIDIRETRQLCLGEAFPASIVEEAELVFKEAEELLAANDRYFEERMGGQAEHVSL